MPHSLNYKHLHYFWVVAHEGSIAKASKKLHITPQTISGQLSLLEERIGNPLFEKAGRGLTLTDTGRLVMRYADDIFELGRELTDVLRGAPNVGASEFIVSAASALPKTVVYKIIEPALELEHEVNLICKEGPVESILAELAIHKVDMVLSDTPVPSALNVRAYSHYLGESTLTAFATPKLAKILKHDFPRSLDNQPALMPTTQYAVRHSINEWLQEEKIYPIVKGQFDDSALMKSFCQAGLGVVFMPTVIVQEVVNGYGIEPLGEISELKQKFYAISAERKIKHPAIAAICDNARSMLFERNPLS